MTDYVAPAACVLTVIHVRDPAVEPKRDLEMLPAFSRFGPRVPASPERLTARSHDGATMCGMTMIVTEQWVPVTEGVAPVCPACQHGPIPDTPLF